MDQINQGGFKLKSAADRVIAEKKAEPAATGGNDIAAMIAERLKARNKAIDSDSDDDDWDSD